MLGGHWVYQIGEQADLSIYRELASPHLANKEVAKQA
ncbi:Uncharacterised protein [Vibrio cholerae]|nr:Uncharacterised protein [Vibrio cholerae]CSC83179.1 Uncharacterised protein [Vibrio cholerae]CSI37652.1 Uncharacterised protein [Vibrio cholerae]